MSRFIVALLAASLVGVAYADDPRDPSEYGQTGARTQPGPAAQPIPADEDAEDLRLAGADKIEIRYDDADDKAAIRTSLEGVKGIEITEKTDAFEVRLGNDPKRRDEVRTALEDIEGANVSADKDVFDVSIETDAKTSTAGMQTGMDKTATATEQDALRIRYDNADEKSRIEKALDDMDGVEATDRGTYLEIDTSADPNLGQRVRDALNDIDGVQVNDRAGFVEIEIGQDKGAMINGADTAREQDVLDKAGRDLEQAAESGARTIENAGDEIDDMADEASKDLDDTFDGDARDLKRVDDEGATTPETKTVDDDEFEIGLEGAHDKPGIKIGEEEEAGVKSDVSVDMIGAKSGDIRYENGKYILTNTYEKGQVKVTHTEKAVRSAGKDVKWGARDVREDLINAANDIIDAVDEAGEDVGREIDETFETEEELEREEMQKK